MNNLALPPRDDLSQIKAVAINGLRNAHTRRACGRHLDDFLAFYATSEHKPLSVLTAWGFKQHLIDQGLSPSAINQALWAVRRLAKRAAAAGLITFETAHALRSVEGERREGRRMGNWLSIEQAEQLLAAPDATTTKGKRDRALLAILLGCGLRREEAASLRRDHLQVRKGRWVIVDLVGKRGKRRSIPVPVWTRRTVEAWIEAARIEEGPLFRAVNKAGAVGVAALSAQAIRKLVADYALKALGVTLAPHDLRRTFARLAAEGDADMDQLRIVLGHDDLKTTQLYVGSELEIEETPGDRLGIAI